MSEASREVFWPEGTARLALLADIYIFRIGSCFLPFSPTAEPGPRLYGYD